MRAYLVFKVLVSSIVISLAFGLAAMAQVPEDDTTPLPPNGNELPTGADAVIPDPVPQIDKRRKVSTRKKPKELRPPKNIPKAVSKPFSARSAYSRRANLAKKKAKKKSKKGKNRG